MSKEFAVGKRWVSFGHSWRGFGIGFRIDKYSLSLDLGFIWFGVEF